MGTAGAVMARPKGRPRKDPEGVPKNFRVVSVRASEEWAAWLERGAEHCRMNLSTAIDVAIAEYFKSRGFEEPPPRRY